MSGHLLTVKVHKANTHDTKSGGAIFEATLAKYPTLQGVCGDAGYRGTFKSYVQTLGKHVEIVEKIKAKWEHLPKRWIVERTFAWLNGFRRVSKHYEITTDSAETFVKLAHIMVLRKRVNS